MDNQLERKNMLWNMIGSMLYALTSMTLGIVVTRLVGDVEGGIFLFAFSTLGQQLYIISYFGMRPIQVTDMKPVHTFGDYRRFRYISAIVALLAGFGYTLVFARNFHSMVIWISLILYKVIDGIADCYESEFQRQGKLYITGQSLCARTLFSITIFLIVLAVTKNLTIACIAFVPALLIGLWIFAIRPLRKINEVQWQCIRGSVRTLFRTSVWLFVSAFLDFYVFAAAKYAVNDYLGEQANTYFSTIFIPTSVINMMAGFVIRPVLTKLSLYFAEKRRKEFRQLVLKIAGLILGLTLFSMGAAAVLGIPVLSILLGSAGKNLAPYTVALVLVILGGGFYAILNLMYYVLVIFKAERAIFGIYVLGCVLAYVVCNTLVKSYAINGAAISYCLVMGAMMLMFIAVAIFFERKRNKS